jgi:hypothetical protein
LQQLDADSVQLQILNSKPSSQPLTSRMLILTLGFYV